MTETKTDDSTPPTNTEPRYTWEERQEIARTIINQSAVHQRRLVIMTGAKDFVVLESGVAFRIGRNAKGVTHVHINLTPAGLYDMQFGRMRGVKYTVIKEFEGVYCDQLKELFEETTGMYLSL